MHVTCWFTPPLHCLEENPAERKLLSLSSALSRAMLFLLTTSWAFAPPTALPRSGATVRIAMELSEAKAVKAARKKWIADK